MKKTVTPRKNDYIATGVIVKNDAYINGAGTCAHFRMAVSSAKDKPSVFFDCVMFSKNAPLPVDILKKGSKIEAKGYFHMNEAPAKDNAAEKRPASLEFVVTSLAENTPVEIDVPDVDAAPAAEDMPGDIADPESLGDIPEEI